MTLLLTNDDGIDAPGIQALRVALEQLGYPNWLIAAPAMQLSGCSHQFTRGEMIMIEKRSPQSYAIHGTPVDCTRVTLSYLAPETQLVLSGINAGGNLGADVYASGTVAAVREATLHRVPGIAISNYIHKKHPIDWAIASRLTARVLEKLLAAPIAEGLFWNVNLPHITSSDPEPEIVECPQCTQPLPIEEYMVKNQSLTFVGHYEDRPRNHGSDTEVCFSGNIALTPIRLW